MKGERNVKKSKTLKSYKTLMQEKNNYNKNQKEIFVLMTKIIVLIHIPKEVKPTVKLITWSVSRICRFGIDI